MSDTEYREELLSAEVAADWLRRLQNGGPAVHAAFGRWLRESPRNVRTMLLATAYQHAFRHMKYHHRVDVGALRARCAGQRRDIEPATETQSTPPSRDRLAVPRRIARSWNRLPERGRWAVAAAVAIVVLLSFVAIAMYAAQDYTMSTGPGEWRTVRLIDGTTVRAGPRTSVSVDISDSERVLHVARGEVMVYVAKDPGRPFFVRTDLATARAIGTAFAVQHTERDRVSITVQEGLVGVARASLNESIVLGAGERVLVMRDGAPLRVQRANIEQELAWVRRMLHFDHTIADAIRELNARNLTQIRLLESPLGERRVVGSFAADDPLSFAKFLERGLPLSAVEDGRDRILLVPHAASAGDLPQGSVER